MKPLCHLALLLALIAACSFPAAAGPPAQGWGGGSQTTTIQGEWRIAVSLHPRNPLADAEHLPATALEMAERVARHRLEYLGRTGPQHSFLLRLADASDHASAADAANALRMLPDILWVSVMAPDSAPSVSASSVTTEPVSQFMVLFHDPATRRARSRLDTLPEALIQAVRDALGNQIELVRPMSGGAWVFRLPAALPLGQAEAAMERLRKLPQVEAADLSLPVYQQLLPNDPLFQTGGPYGQYNLLTPGAMGPWGAPVYGIDAVRAWNVTTGSASTRVAVIDSGILFGHPDLAGRVLPGRDFIDNDANAADPGNFCTNPPRNSTWHGTHVAATIAANGNEGVGAAGVDWNTRIVPVRSLGPCGVGAFAGIIDGMRWAVGLPVPGVPLNPNPARIINMSLGGTAPCGTLWQNAINDVIASGALVVVSAGNNNTALDNQSPASCNGVITVVASDPHGSKASYSNYGLIRLPELAAPGGDLSRFGLDFRAGIIAAGNTGTTGPANHAWTSMSGTSMAAPHVAGVASLMLAINPALTASQLHALITGVPNLTPFPPGSDLAANYPHGGRGILNAYKAVLAAQASVPPPPPAAGPMLLRDAIYLYDQPFDGRGDKTLTGVDCDVFKLVLDVKTGYTDLAMGGAGSLTASVAGQTPFPATIVSEAPMFAYSLYGSQQVKTFNFRDAANPDSAATIGTGTVFGYCFSRNVQARVYLQDKTSCENVYSNGNKTSCNAADNGVGGAAPTTMTLRDAIYLYNDDVRVSGELQLGGSSCDVLQLLLDVESGHTDLTMYEGNNVLQFPARIFAAADMFAYALYSSSANKAFGLRDRLDPGPDRSVGKATAFAYCYSTTPGAFVFRKSPGTQSCSNSAGQAINCPF